MSDFCFSDKSLSDSGIKSMTISSDCNKDEGHSQFSLDMLQADSFETSETFNWYC